jgi:hypothetical protein
MGLGGYLTWTAVAREIRALVGNHIKLLPVEKHGHFLKIITSEVFDNNPDFFLACDESHKNQMVFPIILNNPTVNYCKQDTTERAYHRFDSHIIEQACEYYGIENPELKCVINLTNEEKTFAEDFHQSSLGGKDFLAIEPFSKDNYTHNREYPLDKWQSIVNDLHDDIMIVQVGTGAKALKNVVDLRGQTTFRQALALIGRSNLFLAPESGLVHGATAVNTKSLVIITGYQAEKMVAYPQNINVNIGSHGPCGLKIACHQCQEDAQKHDWHEIVDIVRAEL